MQEEAVLKSKFWKNFFKVIAVIFVFLCIGLTNGKERNVSAVESFLSGIITIPQKGFRYLQNWFSGNEEALPNTFYAISFN